MEEVQHREKKQPANAQQMHSPPLKDNGFDCYNLKKARPEFASDYLKWLCYTHNGAHVVAIVTQDKVP